MFPSSTNFHSAQMLSCYFTFKTPFSMLAHVQPMLQTSESPSHSFQICFDSYNFIEWIDEEQLEYIKDKFGDERRSEINTTLELDIEDEGMSFSDLRPSRKGPQIIVKKTTFM